MMWASVAPTSQCARYVEFLPTKRLSANFFAFSDSLEGTLTSLPQVRHVPEGRHRVVHKGLLCTTSGSGCHFPEVGVLGWDRYSQIFLAKVTGLTVDSLLLMAERGC